MTFRVGFPAAFRCNRGKHVRIPHAAARDQIHHRLWFCCDSFFTFIFLCSFRHHFRTNCRNDMADVEQTQKMISFITCEIPFVSICLRVGFWCRCTWWCGSGSPNWYNQTTNQDQLCGFWKHVSLWGFFPLSSWSLLRCLQRFSTKLPHAKNSRLKRSKQHCLDHNLPMDFFRVGDLVGSPRSWSFWYVFPWKIATIRS